MTDSGSLVVEVLHVDYGPVAAVRGVSLQLNPGEAVAVIGSNGAGKSSLLRGIMGQAPRRGSVRLDGQEIGRWATNRIARAGIAYVPEGRELFPGLTVLEELQIGGRRCVPAERARRQDQVVALFPRLGERLAQVTRTLSGGEQQMVAVGRALMMAPRVLLLDEPSLGLAPVVQDAMYAALRTLRDQGMTMLLVEQNAFRALDLCARAHVLALGAFTQSGPSAELRQAAEIREAYLGA